MGFIIKKIVVHKKPTEVREGKKRDKKSISVLYVSQMFIIDKYYRYVPRIVLKLSQQLSLKLSRNCLKIVSDIIHKIVRKIVQKGGDQKPIWLFTVLRISIWRRKILFFNLK